MYGSVNPAGLETTVTSLPQMISVWACLLAHKSHEMFTTLMGNNVVSYRDSTRQKLSRDSTVACLAVLRVADYGVSNEASPKPPFI